MACNVSLDKAVKIAEIMAPEELLVSVNLRRVSHVEAVAIAKILADGARYGR